MHCISRETEEGRQLELDTSISNEIVRDLVTQMFTMDPKPSSSFATDVVRKLVRKYPFINDVDPKVSEFVRHHMH